MSEVFTSPFPFIADTYTRVNYDGDRPYETEEETWRPGVRWIDIVVKGDGWVDDGGQIPEADAIGQITITVVSRHRPAGYQERVFYTRQFTDPDGKTFGKGKLFCVTANTFKRRKKGWWLDQPYQISDLLQDASEAASCAA